MTRRRLLKLSLLGSCALTGGLLAGGLLPGRYAAVPGLRCLSAKEHAVLAAAAGRLLAGARGLDVGAVARYADRYAAGLDAGLARELRGLLHLLEHSAPLAGVRGRFTALSGAAQDIVLRDWQESPLALRRQGFQALKALCGLGWYQDPRSFAAIGYSGPLV